MAYASTIVAVQSLNQGGVGERMERSGAAEGMFFLTRSIVVCMSTEEQRGKRKTPSQLVFLLVQLLPRTPLRSLRRYPLPKKLIVQSPIQISACPSQQGPHRCKMMKKAIPAAIVTQPLQTPALLLTRVVMFLHK